MHNHHTFVRCPDSLFSWYSLVWYNLWWLYPSLIQGVTENSGIFLKYNHLFGSGEICVAAGFLTIFLKRMRVHPPLLRRGSQPDESIHLTPLCIPPVSKRVFPFNPLLRSSPIFGDDPVAGGVNTCGSLQERENNFPCIPAEPGFDIEMWHFFFSIVNIGFYHSLFSKFITINNIYIF